MKFQLISGRSRFTFLAAKRIHAFGISAACGTLTEGIHVYFIHIHSKEGLAWFDGLVRSEWASLPYCITIALLSVACFPFSVCVFTSICQYVQRHCTTGMYTTALLTQRSGCIKLQQLACNNIRISNRAFCLSQCQECYCCVGAGVGLCVSKSSRFIQRSR